MPKPPPLTFAPTVEPVERRWMAVCDACHCSMSDGMYQLAEKQAGPRADPPCPGCGRRAWSFHSMDD